MKKILALSFAVLSVLCACQKEEMNDALSSENSGIQSGATRSSSSFSSAFGIDWSSVSVENSPSSYPAFKTMKVTSDADYLYLLLTADPGKMKSGHAYDNVLNVYLYDSSAASGSGYWQQKSVNVSAMGGWLVKNSQPRFTSWGSGVSSQAVDVSGTYYYEIRYPRSISPLLSKSSTHVGVYMNNNYQRTDGTYASSYSIVGLRPAQGSNMYWLSLSNGSSGSSSSSGNSLVSKTYTESSSVFMNPEKGLYQELEYWFKDGKKPSVGDISFSDGTLVLTEFYLKDYRTKDLDSNVTDVIQAVFDKVRKAGKKAIVRFAYTSDTGSSPREASFSQMKRHIDYLASSNIFSNNVDVIYVVQAGFIGTWGEWYYTSDSNFDYSVSGSSNTLSNYSARRKIVTKLLSAVPSSRQVAIRTPFHKRFVLSSDGSGTNSWTPLTRVSTGDDNSRLALHNDVFLCNDGGEMGTFKYDVARDKEMWKQQSAYLICGGETAYSSSTEQYAYNLSRSQTIAKFKEYHYSYLHKHPGSNLYSYWDQQGWIPYIKKALGYRLWVSKLDITGSSLSSGKTVEISLTIKNSGAAPVINSRPMKLVLLHNGSPVVLVDSVGDVREILSDSSKSYTLSVTLPQSIVSGDKLALWLPDKASNLRSNANYSIRLANSGMSWSNGYNILHTF